MVCGAGRPTLPARAGASLICSVAERRGFGQAIALLRRLAGDGLEALQHVHRQRRAAGGPDRHRRQIKLLHPGMIDERRVHGWHRRESIDLLAGDVGQHPLRIEPDMQHKLRAGRDREQHAEAQAENVKQRQHRERPARFVVRAAPVPVGVNFQHRAEIGVRQHRALRLAGGAAGILQHCHLVPERPVWMAHADAVIVDQRREIDLAAGAADALRRRSEGARHRGGQKIFDAANHQRVEARGAFLGRDLRIEHRQAERYHHLRFGVGDLIFKLARRQQRTEIDHPSAGQQHGEERNHEMRRVRQVQSDMHAGSHAERLQARGGAQREVIKLAIADDTIVEIDRRTVGPFLRRAFQKAFDRHRRRQRHIPGDPLRIGFFPDVRHAHSPAPGRRPGRFRSCPGRCRPPSN